ncbi:hypothetical protein C8R43DRAFT_952772 [Mycena crocata]|nr:hypothetical protein C8R43DRAFT_952772 [Mycena crocata]
MAPTSTLAFVRRDLNANDVASMFDQPTATPSPWIDPHIPEGLSLPKLLALISLCVVGAIMVFILWRWNSVYFSDLPADHKDLLTQWKTRHLKPADGEGSATASTEMLVEPKLASPPPAYTAAADNAAPGILPAAYHVRSSRPPPISGRYGGLVRECAAGMIEVGVGFMPVVFDAEYHGSNLEVHKALERKFGVVDSPRTIRQSSECIHFPASIHFPPMPIATLCHLPFEKTDTGEEPILNNFQTMLWRCVRNISISLIPKWGSLRRFQKVTPENERRGTSSAEDGGLTLWKLVYTVAGTVSSP